MNGVSTPDVLTLHQRELSVGGRFLVVGDIHGEFEMLLRVLASAQYDEDRDILISVGDLIDRGPNCVEVVKFFLDHPRRFCILGNHEGFLLEAFGRSGGPYYWFSQGGRWAEQAGDNLKLFYDSMTQFPLVVELVLEGPVSRIGIVHGEVPIGSVWDDVHDLHIARDQIGYIFDTPARGWFCGRRRITLAAMAQDWMDSPEGTFPFEADELTTPGIDLVISGHSIMPHRLPYRSNNHLWIDTGEIGRAVQQECRDRSRMPSSA
eukprot:TRINITY_DN7188_c0_g1_i7.p2 TRINITY_DN7188_c0_g1~~TRINITY_DN7188_c0_g1_i7.p2  ORF type:complete len:263 (-),score=55.54 TRINITY_DN7188_c0_g1_i7:27-815(-)